MRGGAVSQLPSFLWWYVSGTTFDRKGFKEMIAEVEAGNVGIVIVKIWARWAGLFAGRFYTEVFFRQRGVRFIAVSNNIDSENGESRVRPVPQYYGGMVCPWHQPQN